MLRFLRKYSSGTGIKILYGVLAGLFVIWGVGSVGGERVDVVARVRDDQITRRQLERATAILQRRYEEMMRDRMPPDFLRGLNLPSRALDQLIDEALLRHEAARLGVTVSDADVVEYITRMPELQDGGRFNRERLEAFLLQQRDRGEFEDEIKKTLLFQRLRDLMTDGVQTSAGEVEERYRFDYEQADLAFVRIPATELEKDVTLTDEELQRYLDAHAERYAVPTQVRARYVAYRPDEFTAQVELTDGEIAEYYELNKDERFADPEQVRARHILVKLEPTADDAAKAAARKKADDLLARVRKGEDFAALAKKNSDDAASATKGGDLGLFPRGRMTPAFEAAAFALAPGTVSEVVETPFGLHIIKVEEHKDAGIRPLEAVRDEIQKTLRAERALLLARRQAEQDRRAVVSGKALGEAVGSRPLQESPPFAEGAEVPGVGRVPDFADAAFALREGEVSNLIETDTAVYLLTPFGRVEAHTPALAEVRARVEGDARRERADTVATERAEALRTRAKEIGLQRAAAEAGRTVETTGPFERRAGTVPKLGAAADLRADAFTLTLEAPLGTKVYRAGRDAVVIALRARTPADMNGFAAAKDGLQDSLLQQKRERTVAAYMSYLKQQAQQDGALEVRSDAFTRS
jgi:peptidyl-prolyl cis-trans isomerase D